MIVIVRIIVAAICAAVGVAGLLLPILPGWLFFLVAWAVLLPRHRWTKKAVVTLEQRAPRMAEWARKIGIG